MNLKIGLMSALMTCSMLYVVNAQENNFSINVKAPKAKNSKVFVRYFKDRQLVLDSLVFSGKPVVYKGTVSEPTLVNLYYSPEGHSFFNRNRVGQWDKVDLYVDKGNTNVAFNDKIAEASIKGSAIQDAYNHYIKSIGVYDKQLDILRGQRAELVGNAKQNTTQLKEIAVSTHELGEKKRMAKEQFIRDNPASFFSLLTLKELAGYSVNVDYVEPLFNLLSLDLKSQKEGREIEKAIDIAKRLGIGKVAPDFVQPDVNGKDVRLSDFKGKFVLLDFWASWCGPCRADNPNLVKAYSEFKDKNFEILGLSLDRPGKKADWLKAIEQDGLPWIQVSDLTGWQNEIVKLYGIQAIPQNFLIDSQGKIVAKNLHGNELSKFLKTVL